MIDPNEFRICAECKWYRGGSYHPSRGDCIHQNAVDEFERDPVTGVYKDVPPRYQAKGRNWDGHCQDWEIATPYLKLRKQIEEMDAKCDEDSFRIGDKPVHTETLRAHMESDLSRVQQILVATFGLSAVALVVMIECQSWAEQIHSVVELVGRLFG